MTPRRYPTSAWVGIVVLVALWAAWTTFWLSRPPAPDPEPELVTVKPIVVTRVETPREYRDRLVQEEAARVGVPVVMALAVASVENPAADTLAVSRAGAVGLMQVVPEVWDGVWSAECGEGDLLSDARRNVCYGVHVLKFYWVEHGGNWNLALRAYNGALRYKKAGDLYVSLVMARLSLHLPKGVNCAG